jgi:hypothetical protein
MSPAALDQRMSTGAGQILLKDFHRRHGLWQGFLAMTTGRGAATW